MLFVERRVGKGGPMGRIRFEFDAELGEWEVASDGLYGNERR